MWQGCSLPETTTGGAKSCLKEQRINFHLQPLTLGYSKGGGMGQSGLKMLEERLGMEACGERIESVVAAIGAESSLILQQLSC